MTRTQCAGCSRPIRSRRPSAAELCADCHAETRHAKRYATASYREVRAR